MGCVLRIASIRSLAGAFPPNGYHIHYRRFVAQSWTGPLNPLVPSTNLQPEHYFFRAIHCAHARSLGGCRREQIFDEESITCRRTPVRNLLISRTTKSIPDRLLVVPNIAVIRAVSFLMSAEFSDKLGRSV